VAGGDTSHKAAECPRKDAVVCFNCNQSGHKGYFSYISCVESGSLIQSIALSAQLRVRPRRSATSVVVLVSKVDPDSEHGDADDLLGHISRDCTSEGASGGAGGRSEGQECYKCGQKGYVS
jgi:hypothetical protein